MVIDIHYYGSVGVIALEVSNSVGHDYLFGVFSRPLVLQP